MTLTKRRKHDTSLFEKAKDYALAEAIEILRKAAPTKFDASVEIQLKLNTDPSATDQAVRGTALLPRGTGKKIRVVVISKDEAGKAAEKAGADVVGSSELVDKILGGWLEFDAVVAAPSMMKEVGKLGKVLGPKGLMPSPKAGTVTEDLAQAVKEIKKGRIEFKADKQGNIHCQIGKLSFETPALVENGKALLISIIRAKPKEFKGDLIRSAFLSSTMGPGIKLDVTFLKSKEETFE